MAGKPNLPSKATTDKLSHKIKPAKMSVVEWQFALRRQFGQGNLFEVKNLGAKPVYSDFDVFNSETHKHYKVAIRSQDNALNFCTCNDFKTNGLSTCKHIEYVLHQIRIYPPYNKILIAGYRPDYSSIYLKYGAIREVKIKIGILEKGKFEALSKKYFNIDHTLKTEAYHHIFDLVKEAKSIHDSFRIYDDAMEYILCQRETTQRHQKADQLFSDGIFSPVFKNITKTALYDYQKLGVMFMVKAGRSLLADDMGLGKTLQSLSTCEVLAHTFGIRKVLVVCPASLIFYWKNEIELHTYNTAKILERSDSGLHEKDKALYLIVSYEMFNEENELLRNYEPDVIIMDEVQRLKTYPAAITNNLKKVKSKYAIVISGTPLETQLEELYAVMQFIDIFKLGPRYQFMYDHQITDKEGNATGFKNLQKIKIMLQDLMLRRTRQEVNLQLPPRIEKNLLLPMNAAQATMQSKHQELLKKLVVKWQTNGKLGETDRQQLSIHITQMRKICTNTFIADQETTHGPKLAELLFILEKANALIAQKIIIITQWERMLRLVSKVLHENKYIFTTIENGTAPKLKERAIMEFNKAKINSILLCNDGLLLSEIMPQTTLIINLDIPLTADLLASRISTYSSEKVNLQILNLISIHSIEQKVLEIYHKKSTSTSLLALGDNIIFATDDQFSGFMKTIEKLVDWKEPPIELDKKVKEMVVPTSKSAPSETLVQLSFFDNLWGKEIEGPKKSETAGKIQKMKPIDPFNSKVIGSSLGKLSAPQLIEKYIYTDALSGEVFLKIPITNEEVLKEIARVLEIISLKKVEKK